MLATLKIIVLVNGINQRGESVAYPGFVTKEYQVLNFLLGSFSIEMELAMEIFRLQMMKLQ